MTSFGTEFRHGVSTSMWLRSLGGGVFAALRGGLVAAITQDWLQVGVADFVNLIWPRGDGLKWPRRGGGSM